MATLTVGPSGTYLTISAAMSAATSGDTIVLEVGYSNETAIVTVANLTVTGAASSTGIVLTMGPDIAALILGGDAPINVYDNLGANTITGNAGNNVITVTQGVDVVSGGAGTDRLVVDYRADGAVTATATAITAIDGRTLAFSGFEHFTILTGAGIDGIATGAGDDIINAGDGANTIVAGDGNNLVITGIGIDIITTGSGNDTIQGGDGAATIAAGAGDNIITTGNGIDTITVLDGNNTLNKAGDGAVTFTGGTGNNTITTGGGIDTITVGTGNNIINAGEGANTIAAGPTGTGNNTITTGAAVDTITVGNGTNIINAGDGANAVTTGSGNNTITTGNGIDTITAMGGHNRIEGGDGANTIATGAGNDTVHGGTAIDVITTGSGSDYIYADTGGADVIIAGESAGDNDVLDLRYLNGNYTIHYSAGSNEVGSVDRLDGSGAVLSSFAFNNIETIVTSAPAAPVVAVVIGGQTSAEDAAWSFTVPAGTFTDTDSTTLSLSATLASGAILPGWLNFNIATGAFSGTPPANFNGTLSLRVSASDGALSATTDFTLTVTPVNDAPTVAVAIVGQTSVGGAAWSFAVPAGTFTDVDSTTVSLSATLATGAALPNWLSFNAGTGAFSGTPPLDFSGALDLQVTASDGTLSVNTNFTLNVTPAPVIDTVESAVSVNLDASAAFQSIINLILTGTNSINGTGNALDNHLTGNVGNNILNGGLGNDTMIGGAGNDTYVVDAAGDLVFETTTSTIDAGGKDLVLSTVSFNMDAYAGVRFVENLTLTGTSNIDATGNGLSNKLIGNVGNNVLNGGAGNDNLNGGLGNDTMIGGAGNDTYIVNAAGDLVIETTTSGNNAGGNDKVQSSESFDLGAYAGVRFIENLSLTGTSNIDATGNALKNVLTGNAANNVLNGGLGKDIMIGGAGHDTFVFNSALGSGNVDTIRDFYAVDDTINLDHGVFAGLGLGTLAADAFLANATGLAETALDRIIYETDTGRLYFDRDGLGGATGVQIATLHVGLPLTDTDFFVF